MDITLKPGTTSCDTYVDVKSSLASREIFIRENEKRFILPDIVGIMYLLLVYRSLYILTMIIVSSMFGMIYTIAARANLQDCNVDYEEKNENWRLI